MMKKVTFGEKSNKIIILRTWLFAYEAARKGTWHRCAIDRERFKRRIEEISHHIAPILTSAHRNKIFNLRFNS